MLSANRIRNVPRPANGEYFVALIIGNSTPDLVNAYRRLLAAEGVLLRHSWPASHRLDQAVPGDVEVILMVPVLPWQGAAFRTFGKREIKLGRFVIDARHHDEVVRTLRAHGYVATPHKLDWPESGGVRIVPPTVPTVTPIAPLPLPPVLIPVPADPDPDPDPIPLAASTTRPPEPEESPSQMANSNINESEKKILLPAGQMLREQRHHNKWSTKDVGKKIGKSSSYVSNVEGALLRVSSEAADRLEALYGLHSGSLPRLGKSGGPKGFQVKNEPVVRTPSRPAPSPKRGRPPGRPPGRPSTALASTVDREQLVTALMRIHAELAAIGLTNLSIKATHGDYEIDVSTDSFTVRKI